MNKILGTLSLQCLAAAMVTQATPVTAQYGAPARTAVSCATPDQWSGAARTSVVTPLGRDDGSFSQPAVVEGSVTTGWNAVFRGRALGRTRGALRQRLARQGGLWSADVDQVGITPAAALAAFRSMGVRARLESGGRIAFRSKDGDRTASRALQIALGRRVVSDVPSSTQVVRTVSVDNAVMRLEGRYSASAVQFVESLPAGMDVYPFGTSFAVHVPARLVASMWDAIDGEGTRVFLVGSSSTAVQGRPVSDAIQYCGASALLRRFPTPNVTATMSAGAIVEIEAQRMSVAAGDVVLTVQNPPYGRGVEIGVSRFSRR